MSDSVMQHTSLGNFMDFIWSLYSPIIEHMCTHTCTHTCAHSSRHWQPLSVAAGAHTTMSNSSISVDSQ